MGREYLTRSQGLSTSGSRLGSRTCLRKGCGVQFRPWRYNQRYCRQPECLHELRRWQAAKRQQRCRATPEGRQRHAEAEQERRKQKPSKARNPPGGEQVARVASAGACAWSHSRRHVEIFCDRPGCYEPPRDSPRVPASYCGEACRAAMHRVQDRERKWLARKTEAGHFKRRLEYQAARAKRHADDPAAKRRVADESSPPSDHGPGAVLHYGPVAEPRLGFSGPREVQNHDPQRNLAPRPRAPPAP
jgi:hypothetical protein